jgi:hypothetical protein
MNKDNYIGMTLRMNKLRHLLMGFVLAFIVMVAGYIWHGTRSQPTEELHTVKPAKLPSDVEGMMEGYVYSDISDVCSMKIKGKRIVRRGREILGLRANLAKTNFLEDISGTFKSKQGVFTFSADEGEWDMSSESPLVLRGTLRMGRDGKNIQGIRRSRIYLKKGIIEIVTDHSMIFHFK